MPGPIKKTPKIFFFFFKNTDWLLKKNNDVPSFLTKIDFCLKKNEKVFLPISLEFFFITDFIEFLVKLKLFTIFFLE